MFDSGKYDTGLASSNLAWLQSMGYNVSRAFVNADENGAAKDETASHINTQYLANLLYFITN